MSNRENITNKKFNKLKGIKFVIYKNKKTIWLFECSCKDKTRKELPLADVKQGKIKSCGCFKKALMKKKAIERNFRHGLSCRKNRHPLYGIWTGIKCRCYNLGGKNSKNYGRRGITIYNKWKNNFQSFYDWSIENGYRKGLSIDRIDNNQGYFPNNCRWVTTKIQANNKRTNRFITHNNETLTISQWSDKTGIKEVTILSRLNKKWLPEKILSNKDYRSKNGN